jgi:hypothetical protein
MWKWEGDSAITKLSELKFTGRICIYHETPMSVTDMGRLESLFNGKGLMPSFRSIDYLGIRQDQGGTLGRPAFDQLTTMPTTAASAAPPQASTASTQATSQRPAIGWNISADQIEKFRQALDRHPPANSELGNIGVCYYGGDEDGSRLARAIWGAMMSTDWGPQHTEHYIPEDFPKDAGKYGCTEEGILILASQGDCITPGNPNCNAVWNVRDALNEAGIPFQLVPLPIPLLRASGQVVIRVGRAPRNLQ